MKIAILTQEDSFVIPKNVAKVLALEGVQTEFVAVLNHKSSLTNKHSLFLQGFGWFQSAKLGLRLLCAKLADCLDSLTGYRLLQVKRSIKGAARSAGVPYKTVSDVNGAEFVQELIRMNLDLLVSFSAPCVFRPPVLQAARLGCINLHCSYLPRNAGVLPSFWVLFNKERETGATVHFMDDKIDNGAILGQTKVPISPGMSMFDLIHVSKAAGGELTCKVIAQLRDGTVKPIPNVAREGSYHTWPTVEQLREFVSAGGRLI